MAALVAGTMGAFANDCTPTPAPASTPTLVYKFKSTVYTPKGVGKVTPGTPGSVCNPDDTGTAASANIVRAKDKTKFAGWIYECTATCDTVAKGSVVAWDSKRKAQLNDAAIATDLIHVIGSKQTQAEWAFKLTGTATYNWGDAEYDLQYAGFGKFSKGFYKSFSGNFAGTVNAVTYVKGVKAGMVQDCTPAGYWDCEEFEFGTDEAAVAYGCWSAKYSKSASKKFAKNGYLKVPSYVTIAE